MTLVAERWFGTGQTPPMAWAPRVDVMSLAPVTLRLWRRSPPFFPKEKPMFPYSAAGPAQLLQLCLKTSQMLAEAQMVAGMRVLGMMGMWRVTPSENARMTNEKLSAAGEVAKATTRALLSGQSPVAVAEQALRPIHRRTNSNVKRLARRGPGKP